MAEPLHRVDLEACKGDGVCVDVCPEDVLELVDGKAASLASRAEECILCGQCVAVCPHGALEIAKLPADDFGELARLPFGYGEFLDFLRLRRSVRVFKDRPVARELTEKILAAASTAPMGLPPHSTEVVIIDRREELDVLLQTLVEHYESTVRAFSNPIGRTMIRLTAGAENYRMLRDHAVKVAKYANEAYHRDGTDRYMYRAPLLLLFHGDRRAMSYEENSHLVCHHAMLTAVTLGLGTTIIGLIPPVVERSRALRQRYAIPKRNKVIGALIVGHPKYKYSKSIRRELAGVRVM